MRKRLTVFMVVMCLLITLVAGCSQGQTETGSDQLQNAKDTSNAQTGEIAQEEKEHMVIKMALWAFDSYNDELAKYVNEKLNIELDTISMSWDNWEEQVSLFAATGDMPDCVGTYTVEALDRFYSWIDQGVIREIPEEMINKYPYVKEVIDNSAVQQAVKDIKGGIYAIPRPESQANLFKASQQYIYYRKDWMENVGISEVPKTVDEFTELLKAFTNDDPDQNGKKDTYGVTYYGNIPDHFLSVFGISPNSWVEEDGQWIPGYLSEKNIEPLKYLQMLYKEGLLDAEFSVNGWEEAVQKFVTNTFGVMIRNADANWIRRHFQERYAEANPDVDPLLVIDIMPPLSKDQNSKPNWPLNPDDGGTEIASHVDDAKLDRILELDNFLLSPEGKELMRFGFEGVHYEKDGENYVILENPETGQPYNLTEIFPSRRLRVFSDWDLDFDAEIPGNPNVPLEYKELFGRVNPLYNEAALEENLAVRYLSTPAKNELLITWPEAFTQIVISDNDVEAAFKEYKQNCLTQGAQLAIEELNKMVNELGIE